MTKATDMTTFKCDRCHVTMAGPMERVRYAKKWLCPGCFERTDKAVSLAARKCAYGWVMASDDGRTIVGNPKAKK